MKMTPYSVFFSLFLLWFDMCFDFFFRETIYFLRILWIFYYILLASLSINWSFCWTIHRHQILEMPLSSFTFQVNEVFILFLTFSIIGILPILWWYDRIILIFFPNFLIFMQKHTLRNLWNVIIILLHIFHLILFLKKREFRNTSSDSSQIFSELKKNFTPTNTCYL